VVGWAIGDRLHRELALAALRKAVAMRRPSKGLIHHSDRASQYCSIDYQAELQRHDVCISISGKGNCYDNAMVETFFKTLKSELVWAHRLPYACPSENRHCPLYRRVLQSDPATLGA
jgi:putative transposase